MQVENSVKPNKRFIIEDLGNGKCTVSFFYNIVEETVEENDKRYLYDMYTIELDNRELSEEIENNYEQWLQFAKKEDYEKLAAEVRKKRNELLKDTDKEMCIDRLGLDIPAEISMTNLISCLKQFFEGFSNVYNGKIAKYRQELRDISVFSNLSNNKKIENKLSTQQAVTDTKLEELTREVRAHNNFAQRVPVLEEQIKVANNRIKDLENLERREK